MTIISLLFFFSVPTLLFHLSFTTRNTSTRLMSWCMTLSLQNPHWPPHVTSLPRLSTLIWTKSLCLHLWTRACRSLTRVSPAPHRSLMADWQTSPSVDSNLFLFGLVFPLMINHVWRKVMNFLFTFVGFLCVFCALLCTSHTSHIFNFFWLVWIQACFWLKCLLFFFFASSPGLGSWI